MKGPIWIESRWASGGHSEGGPGSAFHFTSEFESTKQKVRLPSLEPAILKGLAVLVIDDNRTNRRILQSMLSNWGVKPNCVDSGQAGLDALTQAHRELRPFSLIIMDCQMPEMDGFRTAEKIRQNPDFSRPEL